MKRVSLLALALGPTSALAQPAAPPPAVPATAPTGFSFGSYGRVTAATDLRGRSGRGANIVAYGSRLDLASYAELEVHRDDAFGDVRTRMVATLAFASPLFHESGRFDATLAVRNLYMEARGVLHPGLALWVGSRMYRGDDIYLLNWWPLDNLNTVGGGARQDLGEHLTVAVHAGVNRLDDPYQLQTIRVAPREGFGPVTALLLDRPRIIASAKATYWFAGRTARAGLKLSLYAEYHAMGAGVRQTTDAGARELLPADAGFVVGAQLGGYTGVRNTFFNLFARYAEGLGAFGDLRVPVATVNTRTAARAQDAVVAATGNWESGAFGLMAAAYLRYFRDADPGVFSRNALWEGALVARPFVYFGQHAGLSLEASYQAVTMAALDPVTGEGSARGSLVRVGVVPFVTPAGRGNFTRPHHQLIYVATLRDQGAQRLYAPDDPFGLQAVEHFLGIGTEWWFNSSYL